MHSPHRPSRCRLFRRKISCALKNVGCAGCGDHQRRAAQARRCERVVVDRLGTYVVGIAGVWMHDVRRARLLVRARRKQVRVAVV
jgi:hypothetical protein